MNVLHVINTAETGGGGTHILQLTAGLRRHGITTAVIVGTDGPLVSQLRSGGIPVTVIGRMGPLAVRTLAAQFRAHRPAILHLHGSRSGFLGVLAAKAAGIRPIIYTAHAFAFHRRLPRVLRWLAARAEAVTAAAADRMICLSVFDKDSAAAKGISVSRTTVVPNGIDPQPFQGAPDRRAEFGFVRSAPVAGMVARLVPQKDPLTFVRMARLVVDRVPHSRFLLIGDGPLRSMVTNAVRDLGLDDYIRITGSRSDIPELLATMDIFVLTSEWEGMPIVVLEAMASGKPVVASLAVPALLEMLPDEQDDLMVTPAEPRRYADAVVRLFDNPARREEIGRIARERVARYFTVDGMVDATVQVYRDAAAIRPGAG